jgi:multisubunit Na+/H+ antiporter MnhG subunit
MRNDQPTLLYTRATIQTTSTVAILPLLFLAVNAWTWDPLDYSISTEGAFVTVLGTLLPILTSGTVFPAIGQALHRRGRLSMASFALSNLGAFAGIALIAAMLVGELLHLPPTNAANLRVVGNIAIAFLCVLVVLALPFCALWLRQAKLPHNHALQTDAPQAARR